MNGPVKGKISEEDAKKIKKSEWSRLDPTEIIQNSSKALDYIDDLVE